MSYINKAKVKRLALTVAAQAGRKQFTRVSDSFLNYCEQQLLGTIASAVHRHPSKGKTLKGP